MTPLVFIIVLSWNGKEDTLECLSSLHKLDYPNFETVVVDNGSSDGSDEAVQVLFPSVRLIQTGKNLGYAGGNNVGIRFAMSRGADYVWLLNNDTTVDSQALAALVETAEANHDIAFVGSKVFLYHQPNLFWCVGGIINLAAGGWTDVVGMNQEDKGQFDGITDINYVAGCSLLARTAAISEIGLLPEEYFLYFEETDWNVAAQRKGYRTVLAPASVVWHKYEDTGTYNERFIYYSFRNRIHIVRKYEHRHVLKALKVNLNFLKIYIVRSPQKAWLLSFIALLAHIDALFLRHGKAKWRVIK